LKLDLDPLHAGEYRITGYGENYVVVNERRFDSSVIVMGERIIEDWDAANFDALVPRHFERLRELAPEIVLLGTGNTLRFPAPALSQPLMIARIGMEVMDTRAACRTYNILSAEGRRVAAALLIGV
jgi:uncharacterized protein